MKRMVLFGIFSCVLLLSFSGNPVTADIVVDLNNNALTLGGSGQYDEALALYDQALAIQPENVAVLWNKAGALNAAGRYEEALETYNQIDPGYNPAGVLISKGQVLDSLGRYDEALDAYNQAQAIEPNAQVIEYYIAETTSKLNAADEEPAQDLWPDFVATPTEGTVPLTVQFTDTSTGTPTQWSWDFGDGTSDALSNPTHTYETAGTYDVALTASDEDDSLTTTKYGYITVGEGTPDSSVDSAADPAAVPGSGVQQETVGNESTSILPDLTITKLSMKQKDDVIAGTLTIVNKGGDAGEFTVEYFLTDTYYPDKAGGNITTLGTDTVRNLGSGQERDASDIKMFAIPGSLSPGTYWVGAYIDAEDLIEESDEGNNVRYDIGMVEIGE
ncbi:MAG: PKD domain-containing protein [Methanospirillum sp.]|nr:PKD domain-containing protein [Methanospirillum sp.]